jgi:putative hemolysin
LIVVLIIVAMLLLNSIFAAYELALASVRVERLRALAEHRRYGANAAVAMKSRIEASLAVVQVGITLVGAIAAATGGASSEEFISPYFRDRFGISERWADFWAIAAMVVPLSAVTIVVGELIPKVFALKNAEWVCCILSPTMRFFALAVYPAVWLFETVTTTLISLVERIAPRPRHDLQTGLHELRAQVSLLRASKVIGVQEEQIILQASRLSGMKVRDIMLPVEDIVMLVSDSPLSENLVTAHLDLHTRFPVASRKGDPQSIVGYVTFKEMILLAKTHPGNPMLTEITRPLISLTADLPVSESLRRMLAEHLHLALVRDSDDQVVGMVTQEDVFEELFGDIEDEFDRLPRYVSPAGHQWVVGGGTPLSRLREVLKRPDLATGVSANTSLSDWITDNGERRLRGGDTVQSDGLTVLVRKVRRKRVTEALLEPRHQ